MLDYTRSTVFLDNFGLTQIVNEPTRGQNTLDLIMTNIPERVNRVHVIPGISDHNIPYAEISMKVNRRPQAPRTIWCYKRADWAGLNDYSISNPCWRT